MPSPPHHGVMLDVCILCPDVALSIGDGADAILEEIALLVKCAVCPLLGLNDESER